MKRIFAAVFASAVTASLAGAEREVRFLSPPRALARKDGTVLVSFAVNRPTDAAVYVEDGKGEVIRHLAAGFLGGKNPPPPPLREGLKQEITWDGKADYGKDAGGGPFTIRVCLGLSARYDKIVSRHPNYVNRVGALGCGRDGTVYVLTYAGGAVWTGPQIIAFDRNGAYLRTIMPFPSWMDGKRVRGLSVYELNGRVVPLLQDPRYGFYPGFRPPWPTTLGVDDAGKRLYIPLCGGRWPPPPSIGMLDTEGGCPAEKFRVALQVPGPRPVIRGFGTIALSPDGRRAFLGGMAPHVYRKKTYAAVYVVPLPARTPCTPFFGDPATPGKDESHLGGAPRGLAVDEKGRVFIADSANDRVLIVSAEGKYRGEFPVQRPDYIGVHASTRAVYVSSYDRGRVRIRKYLLSPDMTQAAFLYDTAVRLSRPQYAAAFDTFREPALCWIGGKFGEFFRVADTGKGFSPPHVISPGTGWAGIRSLKQSLSLPECYLAVTADHVRKEIYTRNSPGGGLWYRYRERDDTIEKILIPGSAGGGGKGFQVVPHPDGNLYGLRWPYHFLRWDRNGRPLPWESPIDPTEAERKTHGVAHKPIPAGELKNLLKRPRATSFVPVSMGELPHTIGVRESDGHIFVFSPRVRNRTCKVLHEYLPTGERVSTYPIIWKTTDAVVGPKFDAAGNIYVAEAVHPKGWLYPAEVRKALEARGYTGLAGPGGTAANMYGSIVKFTPRGGMFDITLGRYFPDPFEGSPRLPENAKRIEISFYYQGRMNPASVVGAEWVYPGIGHVGLFRCNCENVTFDVDPFGRVFFPDFHRYRICVIDANANPLTYFGGYGNAESRGPESPVADVKTGMLRPPRPGEKSPFAEPEIALAWPVGVAVTDRYAYIGDSLNRRLMRVRFVYAAEETCTVKIITRQRGDT